MLTACSSQSIELPKKPDNNTAQLPTSSYIENLPFFPQTEDQCGPSSLATMLGARGINISPSELRKKVYIPAKNGSLTTELSARARRYGMLVYPLKPIRIDILAEVSAGNPVLVLQNLGLKWLPRWHFSVVTGYDLLNNKLRLMSGKHQTYEIDTQLFEKTWQRADNWAVVITPPSQLPKTAEASQFLKSANKLELVGEISPALKAYTAALKRWPDNATAYFGAGNTAYTLKRYKEASTFFSTHVERRQNSANGWNNLAYSLLKRQCHDDAAIAISCALNFEPKNPDILESYIEIMSEIKDKGPSASCDAPKCSFANKND